jgi:hypothetical protein
LYALISQKALAVRVIHDDTALLAAHAAGGIFRHGDFVFSSTLTFVRPGQPFHKFGHDGPYLSDPSSPLSQPCVSGLPTHADRLLPASASWACGIVDKRATRIEFEGWCFALYQGGSLTGSQSPLEAVMGGDQATLRHRIADTLVNIAHY